MSNIYLKVTIETQNFNFLGIKIFLPVPFWGTPTLADITEF